MQKRLEDIFEASCNLSSNPSATGVDAWELAGIILKMLAGITEAPKCQYKSKSGDWFALQTLTDQKKSYDNIPSRVEMGPREQGHCYSYH